MVQDILAPFQQHEDGSFVVLEWHPAKDFGYYAFHFIGT
jgi:hypothetical protein